MLLNNQLNDVFELNDVSERLNEAAYALYFKGESDLTDEVMELSRTFERLSNRIIKSNIEIRNTFEDYSDMG